MSEVRLNVDLLWTPTTPNRKTGDIPTAYVGRSIDETRKTCEGCGLYRDECYAWAGFTNMASRRLFKRAAEGRDYSFERAMRDRNVTARAARISAFGDPAHVAPEVMESILVSLKLEELAPLVYTHHWKRPWAQHLKSVSMASCDDGQQGLEAIQAGWTPAVRLPWDYMLDFGPRFELDDSGKTGVVCPAQTKPRVTCNDCQMCSLSHPVWEKGKVNAIGFLDHSQKAGRERRRSQRGRQLPLVQGIFDTRSRAELL